MTTLYQALLKDLLHSTHFKQQLAVRNPINIIWMLEQLNYLSPKATTYLNQLRLKEKSFCATSSRKTPQYICEILCEESIFLKRLDYLLDKVGCINDYALALINLKNLTVLSHCIAKGLDINYQDSESYPLKHAIDNKINNVSHYLYHLASIDKFKIDGDGNNLAHVAAKNKNYSILFDLYKENLSLFYLKNHAQMSVVDIIFQYKQYDTLPKNTQHHLKEMILSFLHRHYTQSQVLDANTFSRIEQSKVFQDILIESNYQRLDSLLSQKNTYTPLRKFKI